MGPLHLSRMQPRQQLPPTVAAGFDRPLQHSCHVALVRFIHVFFASRASNVISCSFPKLQPAYSKSEHVALTVHDGDHPQPWQAQKRIDIGGHFSIETSTQNGFNMHVFAGASCVPEQRLAVT